MRGSETFNLETVVFPELMKSCLPFETLVVKFTLEGRFEIGFFPTLPGIAVVSARFGRDKKLLGLFYKYIQEFYYRGASILFDEKETDLFEELISTHEEKLSQLISPKSVRCTFQRVNSFGLYQGIHHPLARELFSQAPLFPSVYTTDSPYLSNLLDEALKRLKKNMKVLVLGSGAGVEACLLAALLRSRVDATDIHSMAVANTVATSFMTQTSEWVKSWSSDLFEQVENKYDLILFNAPFPVREGVRMDFNLEDPKGVLLDRLLRDLPKHLTPQGELLLMTAPDLSEFLLPSHFEALSFEVLKNFTVLKKSFSIQRIYLKRKERAAEIL